MEKHRVEEKGESRADWKRGRRRRCDIEGGSNGLGGFGDGGEARGGLFFGDGVGDFCPC